MKFKMNQVDANLTQGGAGAPPTTTTPNPATPQASGSTDDGTKAINELYGTKPTEPVKVEPPPQGVPTKTTETDPPAGYVAPPAGDGTGYKPPEGDKRPTEADAVAPKTESTFDEAGMSKEQIDAVKNFASLNKLSKEALTEYVTLSKVAKNNFEIYKAEQVKAFQEAQVKQRGEWYSSLKTDKEFGGDQFESNLKRVDTVLEKFFPNTKNMLTKAKGMLPPDVMKDMQTLHKLLLGQEGSLVNPSATADAGMNEDERFLKSYYK